MFIYIHSHVSDVVCVPALAPVLVPMNVCDIPSHLPPLDDYIHTVPGNTNFPGLLDKSSSTAGLLVCFFSAHGGNKIVQ